MKRVEFDADRLRADVDAGKSNRQIADEHHCSVPTVSSALRRFAIVRPARPKSAVHPQLDDVSWLRARYVEQGLSTERIGAELGVSHPTVSAALQRAGIELRGRAPERMPPELSDPAWLMARYAESSAPAIALELDVSPNTVRRALRDAGVDLRPRGRRPSSSS
ncbi:MAG: hypothetical protein WBP59_00130 [Ilumatobacteraceae bacterium]